MFMIFAVAPEMKKLHIIPSKISYENNWQVFAFVLHDIAFNFCEFDSDVEAN